MPHYNLDDVQNAAKNGNIQYRGRPVFWKIENLGYTKGDVIRCIISLTNSHFYKSYSYDNGIKDDAYKINFLNPNCDDGDFEYDPIYVKFCLKNDCLMINLASFHRDS